MAAIERFEDIKAWQVGRELAAEVYKLSSHGAFAHDYGLPRRNTIPQGKRDQIQRAAVSVMANVVHPVEYMERFLFHRAGPVK